MNNTVFILAALLSMAMTGPAVAQQSNTMPDNSATPFHKSDGTMPDFETERTSNPFYFGAEPGAHGKPIRNSLRSRNR